MKRTMLIGLAMLAMLHMASAVPDSAEAELWRRDLDDARTAARQSGKPMLVVFR